MSKNPNEYAELIDRLANGYREAQVLMTANRLGVFPLLESGPKTIGEMSQSLQVTQRGLRILCDALVALGLLQKVGERYENGEAAKHCLLPSSTASKSAILLQNARLYERWGKLYRVLKTGQPVADDQIDPGLRYSEADFARAMADSAKAIVKTTADAIAIEGTGRMLDVGGGPGLYSIEFASRYPKLHVVILDSKETLEIAGENIRQAGLEDRIQLLPGNVFTQALGGPYDFVLVSNLVHSFSEDDNACLISKVATAMNRGGLLCVKDFFLEPDRTAPAWAALFAVNMLVSTEKGDCYTVQEGSSWLTRAGLVVESSRMITPQTGLLLGKKP
ncbi:MAG: methyltransferase domain-containing protein [Acidobacteria bacterium]|nr:MAG: methyltransferase domain-containing protein [Acidobacteriota bacterium]